MQATQPVNTASTATVPTLQMASAPDTDVKPVEAVQPVKPIDPQPRSGRDLEQTLIDVAEHLRQYLRATAREVAFQVDVDSREAVIIVRDAGGSVVRRIPGEEALHLQQRLNEASGTFLDLFI